MKLSAQQIAIAVVTNRSLSAAADDLQISRNTLASYLKQRRVIEEIHELQAGQRRAFEVQNHAVIECAIQTLIDLMKNSDTKIQLEACKLTLNTLYHVSEADDLKIVR